MQSNFSLNQDYIALCHFIYEEFKLLTYFLLYRLTFGSVFIFLSGFINLIVVVMMMMMMMTMTMMIIAITIVI
jgi:hypothetical protein